MLLQLFLLYPFSAAIAADNLLQLKTPNWAQDQAGKIPIKVINRDKNIVILDGVAPQTFNLKSGRYLISISHVYANNTKRLQYKSFFNVIEGETPHAIELTGERILNGQWLNDNDYNREKSILIQKQKQAKQRQMQATNLAKAVLQSLDKNDVIIASSQANRLHRKFNGNPATHTTLSIFNTKVCKASMDALTSTAGFRSAKETLALHAGNSPCVDNVQRLIDIISEIVSLENEASSSVESGKYVQAYVLFGRIKRDHEDIVIPESLNNNFEEILKALKENEAYEPKLSRLRLRI
ncbi:MAG: hypothetical protein methR_P0597 [Methyloprofundus sp.]|nr:MAG: hypothetical protein methR_P0597 [Methyloprofundus sp.]